MFVAVLFEASQSVKAALPNVPDVRRYTISAEMPGWLAVTIELKHDICFGTLSHQVRSQFVQHVAGVDAVVNQLINGTGVTFAVRDLAKKAVFTNEFTKSHQCFFAILRNTDFDPVVDTVATTALDASH